MKIAIAVYVISLSFAFQPESVFANKVPTPERLQINNLTPLPGRGPIRVRPVPGGRVPVEVPTAWSSHQHVFVGTLDKIVAGPVGRSFPPMFTHKLSFTVKEAIRGDLKPGGKVEISNVARQRVAPVFPEGETCVVGAEKSRGGYQAKVVQKLDQAKIASIRLACALPLGWSGKAGAVTSPWVGLKLKWPPNLKEGAKHFCTATGRPALGFGIGATFAVEKVPPEVDVKWANPDGDGEYRLTVANSGDKPVVIPALRKLGGKVLWNESVVILCQGKTYPAPNAKGLSVVTSPVTLKPGQKLSGIINPLALEGPEWPKGGYRISFQICLGERSSTQSFYYMSRHHDGIRAKLKKGQPIRSQGD
ncbi:MAG: hypothetical protein HN727_08070 [Opitutae bacterium]|nr:hypothetical protein [Opitutae bacterium]